MGRKQNGLKSLENKNARWAVAGVLLLLLGWLSIWERESSATGITDPAPTPSAQPSESAGGTSTSPCKSEEVQNLTTDLEEKIHNSKTQTDLLQSEMARLYQNLSNKNERKQQSKVFEKLSKVFQRVFQQPLLVSEDIDLLKSRSQVSRMQKNQIESILDLLKKALQTRELSTLIPLARSILRQFKDLEERISSFSQQLSLSPDASNFVSSEALFELHQQQQGILETFLIYLQDTHEACKTPPDKVPEESLKEVVHKALKRVLKPSNAPTPRPTNSPEK